MSHQVENRFSDITAKVIFFAAVLIVACVFLFKGCDEDRGVVATPDKTDSLKKVIVEQEKVKDSLLVIAKKKDSVRIETIVKYRYLKGRIDSIPCEELLPKIVNICDSIILVDSSQIATLKQVIKTDSSIIQNYKKIIVNDSTTIVSLNKEVKKQKRQKKIVGGIGAVGWLIAIFK